MNHHHALCSVYVMLSFWQTLVVVQHLVDSYFVNKSKFLDADLKIKGRNEECVTQKRQFVNQHAITTTVVGLGPEVGLPFLQILLYVILIPLIIAPCSQS